MQDDFPQRSWFDDDDDDNANDTDIPEAWQISEEAKPPEDLPIPPPEDIYHRETKVGIPALPQEFYTRETKRGEAAPPKNTPDDIPNNDSDSVFGRSLFEETNVPEAWGVDAEPDADEAEAPVTGERPLLMWLICVTPIQERGVILPVADNMVIGRKGDIIWKDPRTSRRHARFTLEPEDLNNPESPNRFFIWPLENRHPILVNGRAIRGATLLQENDVIHIGDSDFIVKLLEI